MTGPYDATKPYTVPTGENLLKWDPSGDGSFTLDRKEPAERKKAWKGAEKMAAAGDEMIVKTGENSHAEYFTIGTKPTPTTVTWMAGYQLYACLPCRLNYCQHVERVQRWREEHAA